MESSLVLRIAGGIIIAIGVALVSNPELVSNKPVPTDTFQAVERRIWWGLIIGVGTLFLFHHQLHPWMATIAATISSLLFGLLVARIIGIMLDGSVAKQWLWVGVEVVLLAVCLWWYLKVRP